MATCRRGRYIQVNDCVSGHIDDTVQKRYLMGQLGSPGPLQNRFQDILGRLDMIFRCENPPLLEGDKEGTYSHIICPLVWRTLKLCNPELTDIPADWLTYGTPDGMGLERPSGATRLITRCGLRETLYNHPKFVVAAQDLADTDGFCEHLENILTTRPRVHCRHDDHTGECVDPVGSPVRDPYCPPAEDANANDPELAAAIAESLRQRGGRRNTRKHRKNRKSRRSTKNRKASRKNRSRKH